MDRGTWQATGHKVTKNWIRLSAHMCTHTHIHTHTHTHTHDPGTSNITHTYTDTHT